MFPGNRLPSAVYHSILCLCVSLLAFTMLVPCRAEAAGQEMTRIIQERNRVENNLRELKKQLEEYQSKLTSTRKTEATSVRALNNIRTQIAVYQKLIGENQVYLNSLNRQIGVLRQELDVNRQDYGRVSNDFQHLAIAAYKHGGNRDAELLLSSGSMNDAIVRSRYVGFLSQSVRYKVNDLQSSAQRIQTAQAQLQESYRQKEAAMKAQQAQLKDYSTKQKEKEAVLSSIKEDKKNYTARITEVRSQQKLMQSKIESLIMAQQEIIRKEQERARLAELQRQRARQAKLAEARRLAAAERARQVALEKRRQWEAAVARRRQWEARQAELRRVAARQAAERRAAAAKGELAKRELPKPEPPKMTEPEPPMPSAPPPPPPPPPPVVRNEPPPEAEKPSAREESAVVADPEESEIARVSADFDRSAGRLPWPVRGVVVRHFGTSRDRDLNLVTTSNGIDISVPQGSSVRAISGGKVAQIAYLPTFGNVVIVRHPKSYLTVYANLARVSVARGEVIRSGHPLGLSGASSAGGSLVHFEIWKGKAKQNPEKWLR